MTNRDSRPGALSTSPQPGLIGLIARLLGAASRRAWIKWFAAGLVFMGLNALFLEFFIGRLGLSVLLGSVAAAETSTLLRFFVNDRWVFGHRRPTWRRLVHYHGAQAGSLLIWWIATNLLNLAGLHYLVAGTAAIGVSTGFSFLSNFHWVWRHGAHTGPTPPTKVVCGIVVLRDDGAALLQHRDDIPTIADPGLWVFPGGHVEPGETSVQGAVREVEEETCYRSANPRPLADFHSSELGYPGDFRMVFYWDEYDGAQRIECREGQAAAFIPRGEADRLPRCDYLTRIWDLALDTRRACQPGSRRLA